MMKGDRIKDEDRRLIIWGESEVRNMYEFLAYLGWFKPPIPIVDKVSSLNVKDGSGYMSIILRAGIWSFLWWLATRGYHVNIPWFQQGCRYN